MELRVNEVAIPEKIDFNYEELKAELISKVSFYETLVYTDDQIKDAKADKANLNKAGKITGLQLQREFELIPAQREHTNEIYEKGPNKGRFKPGKLLECKCSYVADFVYWDLENNCMVVEDAKGMRTKEYIIKRKLMLHIYGIRIKEV